MTYDTGVRRTRFTIGEALQATLDAAGSNFVPFVVLALVLVAIPTILVGLLNPALVNHSRPGAALWFTTPTYLISLVVSVVTTTLLQAAVARAVVTYLNGGKPDIGECLASTARLILPLIGIAILVGFGILIGLLLLIVPAIFLWVAWSIAVPVEVIERRGVFASLQRSLTLTAGHRWAILGVLLVVLILNLVISFILNGVSAALGMTMLTAGFDVFGPAAIFRAVLTALAAAIQAVFNASAAASIYSCLRQAKEGATPQSLASVFD